MGLLDFLFRRGRREDGGTDPTIFAATGSMESEDRETNEVDPGQSDVSDGGAQAGEIGDAGGGDVGGFEGGADGGGIG